MYARTTKSRGKTERAKYTKTTFCSTKYTNRIIHVNTLLFYLIGECASKCMSEDKALFIIIIITTTMGGPRLIRRNTICKRHDYALSIFSMITHQCARPRSVAKRFVTYRSIGRSPKFHLNRVSELDAVEF